MTLTVLTRNLKNEIEEIENEEEELIEIRQTKRIGNDSHSLFKVPIPEKAKIDIIEVIPEKTHYECYIGDFMEDKVGLHEMFKELRSAKEEDTVELRIASHGGYVSEGITFMNILSEKFKGRATTILDSFGYSMGALVFCLGDDRVVYEHSQLMFHDYSTGAFGKGGEVSTKVDHTSKFVRSAFRKMILSKGFMSEEEFDKMVDGKDYWMDTTEICKRGIATHVIMGDKKLTAKQFLGEEPIIEEIEDEEEQLFLSEDLLKELRDRGFFKKPSEIEAALAKEEEPKGKIRKTRKKKEEK